MFDNCTTYIIAELSANHNQDLSVALKLVEEAARAGANAIKLQTYTADTITLDCKTDIFRIKGTHLWDDQYLYDLYKKAYTPWEWHSILFEKARELGMDAFSSPFDTTAVDFLETLNVPCYKIASCEITDHILLRKIGQTGKPVIISSGMASKEELQDAVDLLREYGTPKICMLKCTAEYPARQEDANLSTIKDMIHTFNVIGGLSDHTLGIEVPIAAVCLGGRVIEKHFTLSRDSGSPDDAFSITPSELKLMVDTIRIIEKTIGSVTYGGVKGEIEIKKYRRSLFIVKNMKKGDKFTEQNIKSIRPSNGIHTKYYFEILGKECNQDIAYGTPMNFTYLDSNISEYTLPLKSEYMSIDYMETEKYSLKKHELGYFEIVNKPTNEELAKHYGNKYYQNVSSDNSLNFKLQYCEEEINYFNNFYKRMYDIVKNKITDKRFLDVGCGEGFGLKNFKDFGFNVTGIDFSSFGITTQNNSLLDNFINGDIYKTMDNLILNKKQYDVINLSNVLEHVIDPISILNNLKNLLTKNGILVITVPNDFSKLQNYLKTNNYIDNDFWVAPPEHLTYFTLDSLKNLIHFCKYDVIFYMASYPIDFDLMEDHTNYIKNKNIGKKSHMRRIRVENLLCDSSIKTTNKYYKELCELGFGRDITIFLSKQ